MQTDPSAGPTATEQRHAVRGVEIASETTGDGPTFVWGHGLTSSRRDEEQPPALIDWDRVAGHARLTRYDARGHGSSGFTAEPERYGWDEMARDQLGLLDALDIGTAILGGASMGAGTALHSAVRAPDRVAALVLMIPPTAWHSRADQTGMYHQMADIIQQRGVELLVSAGATIAPPDPFVNDPSFKARSAARLRAADPVRLAGVFRGAATADFPSQEEVAAIEAPTLILAWTGDTAHPVGTAEQLGDIMADAELSVASTADELLTWTDRVVDFIGAVADRQ